MREEPAHCNNTHTLFFIEMQKRVNVFSYMLVDNKWMEETMNREITETTCKEDTREGKQRGTKIQTLLFTLPQVPKNRAFSN